MNEPFDSGFQLDKSPVIGQVDHSPRNARPARVNLSTERPRIRRELLEPKRHPFLFAVVLEILYRDLFTDLEYLGRMVDAAPGEIRHVQKSIDTAEIDKHAVICYVFHRA